MKTKCWLLLGTMLSTSLLAQQGTGSAPAPAVTAPGPLAAEAPAAPSTSNSSLPALSAKTNTSKAKTPAKKVVRKKAPAPAARKSIVPPLRSIPLVAGPATVIASNVNVRGLPGLKGEVVAHVTKGEQVIVLEEIELKHSAPDEPSAWAKIQLPEGVRVWVHNSFIDPNTKSVVPKRLNLRGGPGENYSVLGRIDRGQRVEEVTTKGDWTQIEAPTNAYAFVAAQYLKQEAIPPTPAPTVASTTTTPPPTPPPAVAEKPATPTDVAEAPPVAAAPTETPSLPPATPTEGIPGPGATPAPTPPQVSPATAAQPTETAVSEEEENEPLPKRIVMREGIVHGTTSIQAPTHFELISPDNGTVINYLHTDSPDLDLRRYKGMRIVVTGEEGLDARWRRTPVITIEKIEVLE